jgi:hypothetical protein
LHNSLKTTRCNTKLVNLLWNYIPAGLNYNTLISVGKKRRVGFKASLYFATVFSSVIAYYSVINQRNINLKHVLAKEKVKAHKIV